MAKDKKTRRVVDVEKSPTGGRYRKETVRNSERLIKPEVTKFGSFIGKDPVRERSRGGKAQGQKGELPKGFKKADKPKAGPSKRISVFTPGSQEARASKGRSVASSLGVETESTNRTTSKRAPLLRGQREDVTFRPSKESKYSKTAPKGTKTVKSLTSDQTNFELPGGKNNPVFFDESIKNPKSGTFAAAGGERAKHLDTFIRERGLGPKAAAARQAFYSVKAPFGANEPSMCTTAGCTKETSGGKSCSDTEGGGSCNIGGAATTVQPRPRG